MTRSHWPASTASRDDLVLAHLLLELLEEHAVDLHAFEADLLDLDGGEDVCAEVVVGLGLVGRGISALRRTPASAGR